MAEPEAFEGVDIAFFAGTEGEKGAAVQLADEAISRGAVVIDNGSDFRLDPKVPLVVPEVNVGALEGHEGLIANANCSTTQMVVTLAPLAREFGLKKVVVSTYQAVSGAGRSGVEALENGREDAFSRPIVGNAIPQIGGFGDEGYTTEETKMREETRKIFSLPDLPVFATAVRIPVHTGHAESVYVETEREADLPAVLEVLGTAPGVEVTDDFPTPIDVAGEDGTYVGRVRVEGRVSNTGASQTTSSRARRRTPSRSPSRSSAYACGRRVRSLQARFGPSRPVRRTRDSVNFGVGRYPR